MNLRNRQIKRFCRSKIALALPVTFLILFVTTMGIVAFTYYFSVERISVQGTTLKVSTAKQNLLSLDDAVVSTLWQPGSQATYEVADSGGKLNVIPNSNTLTLTVNASTELGEVIFNGSVGKVTYELPYQSSSETGLYLKGDERAITNQSGASMSQLCIESGLAHPEIQLHYRPSVTYAAAGDENGKTVNNIRIYIANLNSSDIISLPGKLPLQIVCQTTQLTTLNYAVSSEVETLLVSAVLDGKVGSVTVPVSTTTQGAVVHLELVICNVSVERWLR
jgi:hypothetical protein